MSAYACPKCESTRLIITGLSSGRLRQDPPIEDGEEPDVYVDDAEEPELGYSSPLLCIDCDYRGTAATFMRERPAQLHPLVRASLVRDALEYLALARDALALAEAPKTLERVRLAISSCKGAIRHAGGRETREYIANKPGENLVETVRNQREAP